MTMTRPARQRGMVLVVSLIMLVVLTLLAVVAINMSTVNLHIVGNVQSQMEAKSAIELAIDKVLGNLNNFETVPAPDLGTQTISLASGPSYNVDVAKVVCVGSSPATGWESDYTTGSSAGSRYNDQWAVTATVGSGSGSGATATITQGVEVQQMVTGCPVNSGTCLNSNANNCP